MSVTVIDKLEVVDIYKHNADLLRSSAVKLGGQHSDKRTSVVKLRQEVIARTLGELKLHLLLVINIRHNADYTERFTETVCDASRAERYPYGSAALCLQLILRAVTRLVLKQGIYVALIFLRIIGSHQRIEELTVGERRALSVQIKFRQRIVRNIHGLLVEIPLKQHIVGQLGNGSVTLSVDINLIEEVVERRLNHLKLTLALLNIEAQTRDTLLRIDIAHSIKHLLHTADKSSNNDHSNHSRKNSHYNDRNPTNHISFERKRRKYRGINDTYPSPVSHIRDSSA